MKVTALRQQQRDPERVNVFVDGKYKLSLTMSQILEEKLNVGLELSDIRLQELSTLSEDEKFRLRALNWATLRPRTTQELRQYIKQKKYKQADDRDYTWLIDQFINKGWVNDRTFAEWWLDRSSSAKKSKSVLKMELISKGITSAVAEELLINRTDLEPLTDLVKKLLSRQKYSDQQKLVRYLMAKGFSYSSIKDALAAVAGEN